MNYLMGLLFTLLTIGLFIGCITIAVVVVIDLVIFIKGKINSLKGGEDHE